jgi:hypothetical protein
MTPENAGQQFQDYIHMTTKKSVVGIIDAIHNHKDAAWHVSHPLTGLYVRPANQELMDMYGKHGLIIRGPAKPTYKEDRQIDPRHNDLQEDAVPDFNHYDEGDDASHISDLIIANPKNWTVTGTIHPRAYKDGEPVHVEDLPQKLSNEDYTEFDNFKYFDDSGRER